MDLLEVKGRVAEALVESIFRRARYHLRPYKTDGLPLRFGRENFSPDFFASPGPDGHATDELLIAVKYRPSPDQFLSVENQRGDRSVLLTARRSWPSLYFILATDRPEPGRSCFQVMSLTRWQPGEPFRSVDLVDLKELRIFQHNVEDHEELIRRIFGLLSGASP